MMQQISRKLIADSPVLPIFPHRYEGVQLLVDPPNLYKQSLISFGSGEMAAAFGDILNTSLMNWVLHHWLDFLSETWKQVMIGLTGPIGEKVYFFVPPVFTAWRDYRTQPTIEAHKPFGYFLNQAYREGWNNLLWDITFHDTTYFGCMLMGQNYYPDIPIWALSILSYLIGIFVVMLGQVEVAKWGERRLDRQMIDLGFSKETYYESRFFIDKSEATNDEMEALMNHMSTSFNLTRRLEPFDYEDLYVDLNQSRVADKEVDFRIRNKGSGEMESTAEVVLTKAQQVKTTTNPEHQFYITKKEKYFISLDDRDQDPNYPFDARNQDAFIDAITQAVEPTVVTYTRRLANNPKDLSFSIDDTGDHWVFEIKSHHRDDKMIRAMRELMAKVNALHTTFHKPDLARIPH